jgi:hypothetical protein
MMSVAKLSRTALTAAAIAAFAVSTLSAPASASTSRHGDEVGAAVAIGIGALIVGGILASKSRKHKHHEGHYAPPPRHHAPVHQYHPAPRSYGPPAVRTERYND